MNLVDFYSNKEVSFRFKGKSLSFFLSQALFSSYDVDNGSRLLLKTLIQKTNPGRFTSLLDAGCGTGVLGISIVKVFPDINATLQDRDALGVYFSRINAEKNKIGNINFSVDLAFNNLPSDEYDLVVSNLPAKAGAPVLETFIRNSLLRLSPGGICAVVVVATLRDSIRKHVAALGGEIIFKEDSREHTVFHYKKISAPMDVGRISNIEKTYFRGNSSFSIGKCNYNLDTVYNIRGFDTVPYSNILFGEAFGRIDLGGHIFIWNPGQGHIPMAILCALGKDAGDLTLASRDVLENMISAHNILRKNKNTAVNHYAIASPLHFTEISRQKETFRWMIFDLTESLDKKLISCLLTAALPVIESGGGLVLTGKSSILSEAAAAHKGYAASFSKKYRGFRILILKKH